MEKILIEFQIYLNDKGLINNHDWEYEKEAKKFIKQRVIFGNLDKYFEDLQNYEDELYCSNCGNDSKKTFNYIRTVANGEVFCCKRCNTENLVSEKPNEDNY
jgi:hypothetical protein